MQTTQQSKRSPAHPFTLRSGQWHNGTNRPAAASSELHLLSGGRHRSSASAELIHAQRSRPNSWLFPPVEAAARTERQTWMPKSTNDSGSRSVHRLHLCETSRQRLIRRNPLARSLNPLAHTTVFHGSVEDRKRLAAALLPPLARSRRFLSTPFIQHGGHGRRQRGSGSVHCRFCNVRGVLGQPSVGP